MQGNTRVKPASSSTSFLRKKPGHQRFQADKGKDDAPSFKCGSTDHLIADCPEASPDDRTNKWKKVKFDALVAKFSVDTLEDPSKIHCA
jgi:hypothetical protein